MNNNEKLIKIIVLVLKVDMSRVNLDTNLVTDLAADSLDLVELIIKIEQEFDIILDEDQFADRYVVSKILELIESTLSNSKPNS